MGVDYLKCDKCDECKNEELFFQCDICCESLENCNLCYNKEKNKFAESKIINNRGIIICDNCIKFYDGKDELNEINFKEYNITKNKLHKKINEAKLKL